MGRSNATRRRRRHIGPAVEAKPSWDLVVGIAASLLLLLSGLNLGLRLWDSANAAWSWLLPASFVVGAAGIFWSHTRPDQTGWWIRQTVQRSWYAIPLLSLGISLGRHPRLHGVVTDSDQAVAAALSIGICLTRLAMLARDRWTPATRRHRVAVGLYASPMRQDSAVGIAPPPVSDGYYQARCRCGWRGPTRPMDSETAETDAAGDAEEHRDEPATL